MILVANLVPNASFRDKSKENLFFKTALGPILLSCVAMLLCSAKTFLKLSEATTSVFLKILQIHGETWGPANLFKTDSNPDVFLWNCDIFKEAYFEEHLRTTASEL